jgi:hypothetical protein
VRKASRKTTPRNSSFTEAPVVADFLNQTTEREELARVTKEALAGVGDDPAAGSIANLHAADPLVTHGAESKGESPWPADEAQIQRFVEAIMQASGFPEDRHRSVEDDVRKQVRIDQVRRGFCKHLQPLQDFQHLQSVETAYLFRTKYRCSCTLLGHRTVIESDDIDVVINAMQRVHCKACTDRQPAGS